MRVAEPFRRSTLPPSAISARREIADRRTVGDVAADRAARAHLRRAEAAHHLAEIGMQRAEHGLRVREPHRRAEGQSVRRLRHAVEPGDAAEPMMRLQVAQMLRDPEAHIGRARDDRRVREARVERGERSRGSRARRRSAARRPRTDPRRRQAPRRRRRARRPLSANWSFAAPVQVARRRRRESAGSRCSGRDCPRAGRRGSGVVAGAPE